MNRLPVGQFFGKTNQTRLLGGLTLTDTVYAHERGRLPTSLPPFYPATMKMPQALKPAASRQGRVMLSPLGELKESITGSTAAPISRPGYLLKRD